MLEHRHHKICYFYFEIILRLNTDLKSYIEIK